MGRRGQHEADPCRQAEHPAGADRPRKAKTITKPPTAVRRDLSRNAATARRRGGKPGHSLDDRTRQQLSEVAKRRNIPGRSKMGKYELIEALRKAG